MNTNMTYVLKEDNSGSLYFYAEQNGKRASYVNDWPQDGITEYLNMARCGKSLEYLIDETWGLSVEGEDDDFVAPEDFDGKVIADNDGLYLDEAGSSGEEILHTIMTSEEGLDHLLTLTDLHKITELAETHQDYIIGNATHGRDKDRICERLIDHIFSVGRWQWHTEHIVDFISRCLEALTGAEGCSLQTNAYKGDDGTMVQEINLYCRGVANSCMQYDSDLATYIADHVKEAIGAKDYDYFRDCKFEEFTFRF